MTTAALYTLYAFLAIGAAGVFLCLPSARQAGHALRWAGAILGAAALAALAVVWTRWLPPDFQGRALFVLFAAIAVFGAARVITHGRPVYSAVYFVLVVLAVAVLCVLAAAEFLAVALVIVYGGAILVTYVFVIMLAQQGGMSPYDRQAREPLAAVTLGFLLAAAATQAVATTELDSPGAANALATNLRLAPDESEPGAVAEGAARVSTADDSNVRAVGRALMTRWVMALEVAGVLLLVAMVGAVSIARKWIAPEDMTASERAVVAESDEAIRRPGRQAPPF